MPSTPRSNRGRGAAAENRAALVAAARDIFATRGIHAPLSAVASAAGVGQGSLYRHFPTRSSLAVAVFQNNLDELELLASNDEAQLGDVLSAITEQAIVSTALFEMIEIDRADAATDALGLRIDAVLAAKAPRARERGELAQTLTTHDLRLGIAMLTGALAKTPHADRRATSARIWALLPFGPTGPR